MNIDEYLNNLQNDLDQRLSEFGVETSRQVEQPTADDAVGTESKFCPECGTKVAGDAKFCPSCGYRFNKEEGEVDNSSQEDNETNLSTESDYDPEELKKLFGNIYDARRTYLEKAKERLKQLSEIAVEKGHDQDFGWLEAEAPDSDEDEEAWDYFTESQFHVIRYDDFAYQTSEIIGVRFRLDSGEIIITAYYDDDNGEIVEDCELYFNYDFAENYSAVAFCIEVIEKELNL